MSTTPETVNRMNGAANFVPRIVRSRARSYAPLPIESLSPFENHESDSWADEIELPASGREAPPIDDRASAIDELAFLLATDHFSTLEKIWLLEQWRYDMLALDVASSEGFAAARDDATLLQPINKALLRLIP